MVRIRTTPTIASIAKQPTPLAFKKRLLHFSLKALSHRFQHVLTPVTEEFNVHRFCPQ
jgi:hypothetical protein